MKLEQTKEFWFAGSRCFVGFVPGHPGIHSEGLPGYWVGYVEVPVLLGVAGYKDATWRDADFPEWAGLKSRAGCEVFGWGDLTGHRGIRTQADAVGFTMAFLDSPGGRKGFPDSWQVEPSSGAA